MKRKNNLFMPRRSMNRLILNNAMTGGKCCINKGGTPEERQAARDARRAAEAEAETSGTSVDENGNLVNELVTGDIMKYALYAGAAYVGYTLLT